MSVAAAWRCRVLLLWLAMGFTKSSRSATELNAEALRLSSERRLAEALSLFQEAAGREPSNADFLNNVGVVQMRLGRLQEARQTFYDCLSIRPNLKVAVDNLRDIAEHFGEPFDPNALPGASVTRTQSCSAPCAKEQASPPAPVLTNTNIRARLPRVHLKDFYAPENRLYVDGTKPFILLGAMHGWQASTKWSLDYLRRVFTGYVVDFYPSNMPYAETHPFRVPFGEAADYLQHPQPGKYTTPPTRGHDSPYVHVNMESKLWSTLRPDIDPLPSPFSLDDKWMSECMNSATRDEYMLKTHWRILLMGSENAGMFNHWDILHTSSWHAHVRGTKRWHICQPDQSASMYGAGKVDVFAPDYSTYPNFRNARCTEDDVTSGEILYYPEAYWHQTLNTEPYTTTITSTVVNAGNARAVEEELAQVCSNNKFKWSFSEALCTDLKQCFRLWRTPNYFATSGETDLKDEL